MLYVIDRKLIILDTLSQWFQTARCIIPDAQLEHQQHLGVNAKRHCSVFSELHTVSPNEPNYGTLMDNGAQIMNRSLNLFWCYCVKSFTIFYQIIMIIVTQIYAFFAFILKRQKLPPVKRLLLSLFCFLTSRGKTIMYEQQLSTSAANTKCIYVFDPSR